MKSMRTPFLASSLASSLLFAAACTGGATATSDGGADDAGAASSCAETNSSECSAGMALRCDGRAPSGCLTTATANVYCCAVADADSGGVDGGVDGGRTTSPDGVPYPTTRIGWKARAGSTPGDVIANITLPGYAPNSATLVNVSMADLYDPNGKSHDAIVILGVSGWEQFSPRTMDLALASKRRIRVLSVLGEGGRAGMPATQAELAKWRGSYTRATHMHDPGFVAFGAAFDAAAVPLVMIVVAKTMEICSSAVGAPASQAALDGAIDDCTR